MDQKENFDVETNSKEESSKRREVAIRIIVGVIVVIGILFAIPSSKKPKTWYEEAGGEWEVYDIVLNFLRQKVNYPETFEFVTYPNFTFGTAEERNVGVTGVFKASNAFGVYQRHSFAVVLYLSDEWEIKYYRID